MLIPRGFRRSSRRISPGCTGGSRRAFLGIVPPSVVVHDLDVLRFAVLPHEADPILVIDPDAVLPPPITAKGLEVIARKRAQVVESLGCMQLRQLALRRPEQCSGIDASRTLGTTPRRLGSGRNGSPAQHITYGVICQTLCAEQPVGRLALGDG